jgi:hypothetical protein
MITENEIITGERFIRFADLIFVNQDKINFHRTLLNYTNEEKFIKFNNEYNIDKESLMKINIMEKPIIYVYGDHFLKFCENILPMITTNVKLVVHNSDENIDIRYKECLNNYASNIIGVWAQNIDIIHSKLDYLPIGIANSMWGHGNTRILSQIMNLDLPKTRLVYFNFAIHTNHQSRSKLHQTLLKNGFITENNKPFHQYLDTLAQYKFAFSPNGGGIDCHRTWECLNLGVIPILEKSILADRLEKDYPVLVVEDWNSVTSEYLERMYTEIKAKEYDNRKLKLSYFEDEILRKNINEKY